MKLGFALARPATPYNHTLMTGRRSRRRQRNRTCGGGSRLLTDPAAANAAALVALQVRLADCRADRTGVPAVCGAPVVLRHPAACARGTATEVIILSVPVLVGAGVVRAAILRRHGWVWREVSRRRCLRGRTLTRAASLARFVPFAVGTLLTTLVVAVLLAPLSHFAEPVASAPGAILDMERRLILAAGVGWCRRGHRRRRRVLA